MYGRKGKLLVIASCPGDAHPGQLHSRFSRYDGVWCRFLPVQYSRADFSNNWKMWWSRYFARALHDAQSQGGVHKCVIIAIRGGGPGCAEERQELGMKFRAIPNIAAASSVLMGMPGLDSVLSFFMNGGSTPVQYYEVDANTAEAYINRQISNL